MRQVKGRPGLQGVAAPIQDGFSDRSSEPEDRWSATGFQAPERRGPAQQQSRLASDHSMMLKEVHNLAFCPATVVSIWLCQKSAMAAMSGFQQRNVRVHHN